MVRTHATYDDDCGDGDGDDEDDDDTAVMVMVMVAAMMLEGFMMMVKC